MFSNPSPDIFISRTDGKADRPDPGEDQIAHLMDLLYDLSVRLKKHRGEGPDLLERYDFFVRNSSRGRGCTYAHKCRQLFLSGDWKDISHKLDEIFSVMKIEG